MLPVRGSFRIATLLRALHLYLSSTLCDKFRQDDEPCSRRPACSAPSPEEGGKATAAALGSHPNIEKILERQLLVPDRVPQYS